MTTLRFKSPCLSFVNFHPPCSPQIRKPNAADSDQWTQLVWPAALHWFIGSELWYSPTQSKGQIALSQHTTQVFSHPVSEKPLKTLAAPLRGRVSEDWSCDYRKDQRPVSQESNVLHINSHQTFPLFTLLVIRLLRQICDTRAVVGWQPPATWVKTSWVN